MLQETGALLRDQGVDPAVEIPRNELLALEQSRSSGGVGDELLLGDLEIHLDLGELGATSDVQASVSIPKGRSACCNAPQRAKLLKLDGLALENVFLLAVLE